MFPRDGAPAWPVRGPAYKLVGLKFTKYNQPADWYYPGPRVPGSGTACQRKAAEAEGVFHRDWERDPRNPRSLFSLWRALEAQNKTVDAGWDRAWFEAAWKGAADRPRLADS
jgi:hypothetical protein